MKAVVFDLDYTLWPCWCDVHIELPVKTDSPNSCVDSYGYKLQVYKDVPMILNYLKKNGYTIISASRTPTVHIAKELLQKIRIKDEESGKMLTMASFFDNHQWGTGSKIRHIRQAAKELGLQEELKDGEFILFDDEYRNTDVESIGCKFVYIRDTDTGMTKELFNKGLKLNL